MEIRIAKSEKPRIVIVGGGFGGLKMAQSLANSNYQVVVIDKNNFHQFQPLFYQVATSGLDASSIIFPFRKIFQRRKNIHFRLAEVHHIDASKKLLETSLGELEYDKLIIASGAGNNFFGNENIENFALPMKSINESLRLRNYILERFEESLSVPEDEQKAMLTFVIAGAGPTGVELAGTLAEMKRFILPKDYPELNFEGMKIIVVEGSPRVLSAMKEQSSTKAQKYLEDLGVEVRLSTLVSDYDKEKVILNSGESIHTKTLIWAAGIQGNFLSGIDEKAKARGNRILVNEYNEVLGMPDVYAIGDVACMAGGDPNYPHGHPQLAQAAIQQGKCLANNLRLISEGEAMQPFRYKNLGSMATVGRNKAVVELPNYSFGGIFAWLVWMVVHLRSILGVKNKFVVLMNWVWNYFTYNLSLRLIIKRKDEV